MAGGGDAEGTVYSTASEFGNTYLYGSYPDCACREGRELSPCADNRRGQMEAIEECQVLYSDLFQPAHSVVNPREFYDACLYDMCVCPTHLRCLCHILLAYTHEARKRGVNIEWQRTNYCALSCPKGAVYQECTSPCIPTCETIDSISEICEESHCVPACQCPAGMVLHEFECIFPEDCPVHDPLHT
ncbi:putative kielin/chordin-like protein [Apostichopus japonicus]|uniref:Putative kielin/chordin-like protein n=1 Tax=Stichopus japonicus TaxID=307972 RepID=A0A2G8LBN9_STIJA|nr:putative kielin/chordin-like protein [Apostichopus japonicus]